MNNKDHPQMKSFEKCQRTQVILLLCGIPGCGKSTFICRFVDYLSTINQSSDNSSSVHPFRYSYEVISYDSIGKEMPWNEHSFGNIRQRAKDQLLSTISSSCTSEAPTAEEIAARQTIQLILVDDIMYLRSMRREIYVIARDHSIPLVTIWISTDPAIADERNQYRNQYQQGSVSNESFQRIVENFQSPDPSFIFDRYFLQLDGSNVWSIERSLQSTYLLTFAKDNLFVSPNSFETVLTMVKERKERLEEELLQRLQTEEEEQNRLHDMPTESKISRLDDTIRKMINQLIARWKQILIDSSCQEQKEKLTLLAKLLSEEKSKVLEIARQDVCASIVQVDSVYLQLFVKNVSAILLNLAQASDRSEQELDLYISLLNVIDHESS